MDVEFINNRSGHVVDAAIRVHRALGPGLLESAYQACLAYELRKRGLHVVTQVALPVAYDGMQLKVGYRMDMVVEDVIIVELKTVPKLLPVHEAQLLTYLTLSVRRVGLLINFYVPQIRDGIRRMVNNL